MKHISLVAALFVPLFCFAQEHDEEAAAPDPAEPRVEKVLQQLQTRERKLDPFGLSMNPMIDAKLEVSQPEPELAVEPQAKTTLEEALAKLEITGVLPNRAILIGSSKIQVGQKFRLSQDDFVFQLTLTSVKLGYFQVSDLETGEDAIHRLQIAPTLPTAPGKPLLPVRARPDVVTIP